MAMSTERVIRFLEKEIKTYKALAYFLSRVDVQERVRPRDTVVLFNPAFYTERLEEAKRLVDELKKSD
jgi:hypothetical protein